MQAQQDKLRRITFRKDVFQNIIAKTKDEYEDLNNFSTTETPDRLGNFI